MYNTWRKLTMSDRLAEYGMLDSTYTYSGQPVEHLLISILTDSETTQEYKLLDVMSIMAGLQEYMND